MLVYSMRNRRSGRRYVGKTVRKLKRRVWEHAHAPTDNCTPIDRAVAKCGVAAFEVEVLERCDDEGELSREERRWIAHFDTFRGRGYNCTEGGEGILGYRHTEETKRRMSRKRRGKLNPNWGKKAEAHPKFGVKMSVESKRKMSEDRRKNPPSFHTPVEQLDMEGNVVGTYVSMSAAERSTGTSRAKIRECLSGKKDSIDGFRWRR